MPAQSKIFHGLGVAIAKVTSDDTFEVSPVMSYSSAVDWSTGKRFEVTLQKTPGNIAWNSILWDSRGVTGDNTTEIPACPTPVAAPCALTCIGTPLSLGMLQRGCSVGAVYIERTQFNQWKPTKFPNWPNNIAGAPDLVEITTICYDNKLAAKDRYLGFKGTITAVTATTFTVSFPNEPNTDGSFPRIVTFNRNDATIYDLAPPSAALNGLTSLASNMTVGTSGALFLRVGHALTLGAGPMKGKKIPLGQMG